MSSQTALASSASNQNVAYAALLALAMVDASGYSVIAPVAPALAHASGAGPALIGALVASFPLGMVVGFALAGAAVKRGHSATLLATSLMLVAAGCLGFIVGHDLAAWFPARVVMGLGSGGLWMGITFATLERWPDQEYLCMSRIFAAYSVGRLVGPALGAIGGVRGPFAAYLVLVGAGGTCALMLRSTSTRRHFHADRAALRLRGFWVASAAISFAVLALGTVDGVLPLHFASELDQRTIGFLYAATAVVVAASAALAARTRPRLLVLGACVLIVTGIGLAGSSPCVPVWIGALIGVGVGIGIGNTGAIGLLFEAVSAERIATAMIIWSQLGILGGLAAQTLGYGAIALAPLVLAIPLAVLLLSRRPTESLRPATTSSDGSDAR